MVKVIWSLIAVLVGSWLVGVIFKIAEDAIHILLVVAGVLGVGNFILSRRNKPATD